MWSPVIDAELPIGISLRKKMLVKKHNIGLTFVETMIQHQRYLSLKLTNQEKLDSYV
jgi:hypothetical protein